MKKTLTSLLLSVLVLFTAGALAEEAPPAAAPVEAAPAAQPAAPAAQAAAPAAPETAAAPTPNKGDVSWMLVSTLLVLMMVVPGLAMFYGGLVRAKTPCPCSCR